MTLKVLAILSAFLLAASPGFSGEKTGTEMVFDTASLEGVKPGAVLQYSHARSADKNIPIRSIEDGKMLVSLVEEDDVTRSEVDIINGKQRRKLHHFPADRGNPIFVTFLESSVSSVTFATKGSPFYIRNRFKDAFSKGGEVTEIETKIGDQTITASQITYRPFKGDRNAAKIGRAFEALEVSFVLSDEIPGKFVSLKASSTVEGTDYFVEEVRFTDAKPSSK